MSNSLLVTAAPGFRLAPLGCPRPNPAKLGSIVSVYCSGTGYLTYPVTGGSIAPIPPPYDTLERAGPEITFSGAGHDPVERGRAWIDRGGDADRCAVARGVAIGNCARCGAHHTLYRALYRRSRFAAGVDRREAVRPRPGEGFAQPVPFFNPPLKTLPRPADGLIWRAEPTLEAAR